MVAPRTRRPFLIFATLGLVVLVALLAGCGSDDETTPASSTTAVASTVPDSTVPDSTVPSTATTTTTVTTTTVPSTTTTEAPTPACPTDATIEVVGAAIDLARLGAVSEWSSDTGANPYAERTATGDEFADRLGLDCGMTAAQSVDGDDYLLIAAWTGPRVAYVVQTNAAPTEPYRGEAMVTVVIDSTQGEFVDGDDRSIWAGTFDSGDTFVIGHVDYVLGAPAKDWVAGPREPFEENITLDAERHAIAALTEAGMRNVGIAEPPQFGSEESLIQFISPTGQISVADVAPTGWFDPTVPRYFTGPTTFETIGGVEVRVTEPLEDDNLGFNRGLEFAWSCDGFVWILEPPFNGSAEELRASVTAIIGTQECQPT